MNSSPGSLTAEVTPFTVTRTSTVPAEAIGAVAAMEPELVTL